MKELYGIFLKMEKEEDVKSSPSVFDNTQPTKMEAFEASMSSTIEDLKLPEIPQDALNRSL